MAEIFGEFKSFNNYLIDVEYRPERDRGDVIYWFMFENGCGAKVFQIHQNCFRTLWNVCGMKANDQRTELDRGMDIPGSKDGMEKYLTKKEVCKILKFIKEL